MVAHVQYFHKITVGKGNMDPYCVVGKDDLMEAPSTNKDSLDSSPKDTQE